MQKIFSSSARVLDDGRLIVTIEFDMGRASDAARRGVKSTPESTQLRNAEVSARMLKFIISGGSGGVQMSAIMRKFRLVTPKDVAAMIDKMVTDGAVKVETVRPKRGRPGRIITAT